MGFVATSKSRVGWPVRTPALPGVMALPGVVALLLPAVLSARVDLVTLPGKDRTELTIYRSVDLTLVHEQRTLTFQKGMNDIQFSWANTLIDPTSLDLKFVKESPDFKILDTQYPANTQATAVWSIDAAADGDAQVEIRYFISGMTWAANYAVVANADETTLRIEPAFRLSNNTGEDFENANTRLVVGEVNLVELISLLSKGYIAESEPENIYRFTDAFSMEDYSAMDKLTNAGTMFDSDVGGVADFGLTTRKEIFKRAVSEYQLYTIEGEEDLENLWSKQLPNPAVEEIPIDVSYEFNPRKYGDRVVKFYKFKNDEEHKLGDSPLPGGSFYVSSLDSKNDRVFQGVFEHEYVPLGEDVEIDLGSDGRMLMEERTMSLSRSNFEFDTNGDVAGYDVSRLREIELRNSLSRPVDFKLTLLMGDGQFGMDWELQNASDVFKKVDQGTAEWEFEIAALGTKVVKFEDVRRTGSRDRTSK